MRLVFKRLKHFILNRLCLTTPVPQRGGTDGYSSSVENVPDLVDGCGLSAGGRCWLKVSFYARSRNCE